MSIREELLADVVQAIRPITGPSEFDIYTTRVIVRGRQYPSSPDGPDAGLGTPTVTNLELDNPRPKVRDTGNQTLRVGPITPQNANGGYTFAQLKPADADGFEYFYLLIGPDGTERGYTVGTIDTRKAFSYYVDLVPLGRDIPF